MPYIPQDSRPHLDEHINKLPVGLSAGELAYVVFRLLKRATHGGAYVTFATMVGSVILTTFRFIWVVVMPYEDRKQAENGDVIE